MSIIISITPQIQIPIVNNYGMSLINQWIPSVGRILNGHPSQIAPQRRTKNSSLGKNHQTPYLIHKSAFKQVKQPPAGFSDGPKTSSCAPHRRTSAGGPNVLLYTVRFWDRSSPMFLVKKRRFWHDPFFVAEHGAMTDSEDLQSRSQERLTGLGRANAVARASLDRWNDLKA